MNLPAPRKTFPAEVRLKARADFLKVQEGGRSAKGRRVILLSLANRLPLSRFGMTVTRKAGGAVKRNRIKRRLREIVRLNRHRFLPGQDLVLIARPLSEEAPFQEMEQEVLHLARKLGVLRKEEGAA